MFEEVPRDPRGLAGLATRRVVVGPFVIGGGVLLAAVGGSVAVAATMITASTIRFNDVPPRPTDRPVVSAASSHAGRSAASKPASRAPQPGNSGPLLLLTPSSGPLTLAGGPPPSSADPASSSPAQPGRPRTATRSTSLPGAAPSPSASQSGPAGNALIYVTGYDSSTGRIQFEFASVQPGAGPGNSDLYSVSSPDTFTAAIAAGITITSGGQLCPPAGSSCTVQQLIDGASIGFYAEAAIDPDAQLVSITELDNASSDPELSPTSPGPAPAPALTSSPSPSPSASQDS